jgi:hypothetical protein
MQNGGKKMQEVDGKGYYIALRGIWEKNSIEVESMMQEKNS